MSDTNRVRIVGKAETTYGVAATSNYTEIPFTGESLKYANTRTQSNRVISDRQRGAPKRTGIAASGSIDGDLAATQYDVLLAGGMLASWPGVAVTTGAVTTLSAVVTTNVYHRSAGSFITDGFILGQVVKTSGFATAGNNGYGVITALTATDMAVAGPVLADEAAGATVTIKGTPLVSGTTLASFSIEEQFLDLAVPAYIMYLGMAVAGLKIGTTPGGIASCGFDFVGKTATATTSTGAGTVIAAATTEAFGAVDELKAIIEGGVAVVGVTDVALAAVNNIAAKAALMTLGAYKLRLGGLDVSGSFAQHFENLTLYNKALNNTKSSLAWVYEDAAGNGLACSLPALYLDGDVVAGGKDGDVLAQMTFSAYKDPTAGQTLIWSRW